MEGNIIASNGMAFSPDDKTLNFCDSRQDTVWAYDLDIESGRISNRRVFISTKDVPARVDGATVDVEGNYWCAHIHDWHVACYDPTGQLIRRIKMPVRHPTSVNFGGPDLDTLYVTSTSASNRLGDPSPAAGGLFSITGLGARGIAEPLIGG